MVKALPVSRIATLEIVYSLLITLQAPVVRRSDNVDTDWISAIRTGYSLSSLAEIALSPAALNIYIADIYNFDLCCRFRTKKKKSSKVS